jgi:hypothetical protein
MIVPLHRGPILLAVALLVSCAPVGPADKGGSITHRQEESRLRYYTLSTIKIDEGAIGLILPVVTGQQERTIRVIQPTNPAGAALLKEDTLTASILSSREGPMPATPTDRALGGMVHLGAILLLLGVAGIGLRLLPFSFGKLVPIGISLLIGSAGALMIAYATVLDNAPWWVTALAGTTAVAVAVWTAWRDNRNKTQPAHGLEASHG